MTGSRIAVWHCHNVASFKTLVQIQQIEMSGGSQHPH